MKSAFSLVSLAMLLALSGCGEQTVELVGCHTSKSHSTASISVLGDKGVLKLGNAPLRDFPDAQREYELDTVRMPNWLEQLAPSNQSATMRIVHLKTEPQFVGGAGLLVCLPCQSIGLPTQWCFVGDKS